MCTALKWILGILGVLVIVGLVAGAVFMWRNHVAFWGPGGLAFNQRIERGTAPQPPAPNDDQDFQRYHMYGYHMDGDHMYGWGGGMPMMRGGGWQGPMGYGSFGLGFLLLGGFFRLIIPLAVLALVAYLFYQMGRRAGSTPAARTPSGSDAEPRPGRKVASR